MKPYARMHAHTASHGVAEPALQMAPLGTYTDLSCSKSTTGTMVSSQNSLLRLILPMDDSRHLRSTLGWGVTSIVKLPHYCQVRMLQVPPLGPEA